MDLMDLCDPLAQSDHYHQSYQLDQLRLCAPLVLFVRYRLSYPLVQLARCAQLALFVRLVHYHLYYLVLLHHLLHRLVQLDPSYQYHQLGQCIQLHLCVLCFL